MAHRNLPEQRIQPVRTIHYIDPSVRSDLTRYGLVDQAEIVRQQQVNTELWLRWKARQAEIKQHDQKFRRFWLGFGMLVGLVFLAGVFVAGWWLWAVIGLGALAIPVVALLGSIAALGGHRCITIVQHMH